jgi:hypothetical protein
MEYIKRKRLLENYRSRSEESYGEITATTIDINIFLTNTYEDIGIYNNEESEGLSDELGNYNQGQFSVTGETDDRYLRSIAPYGVDVNNLPDYTNATGINMADDITTTWDGVLTQTNEYIRYVLGGSVDQSGNYISDTGVVYTTYYTTKNNIKIYGKTTYINYMGGRRTIGTDTLAANSSLSAIYKKEQLLNIVQPPKVRNKVFINRGGEDIFERHSVMSEIKTRNDIDEYRNGYF